MNLRAFDNKEGEDIGIVKDGSMLNIAASLVITQINIEVSNNLKPAYKAKCNMNPNYF